MKKNLFYNSLLSISQFIFPLITFPFVSRTLGPAGVGSVNFIDSFTQYFLLFAALGIPTYGVREISKVRNDQASLNKTFSEIVYIHLLSTVIFAAIYLVASLIVPTLRVHISLVLVGIVIMFFRVATVEWFFVGIEQFAYITKRTLIVRVLSIILLFTLLLHYPLPLFYYFTFAAVYIFNGLTNIYFVRKFVSLRFDGLEIKKHFKPLVIILSSALAVSVYVLLDNMILGFIKGEAAVGFYSTAVRIAKIPFAFLGAIASVMIPQVSRAHSEGNLNEVSTLLNKSFTFICIVGIPVAAGLYISAPFVIDTFAGGTFNESISDLKILTPVILLVGLSSIFGSQLLTPIGKERFVLYSVLIGMAFSLISNFILIPLMAHQGAALTNLLTEVVVTFSCFYFARRFVEIRFDKKIFLQCLFAAAAFIPLAILIRQMNFFNKYYKEVLVIVACILFYTTYLWFFVKNIYIQNLKESLLNKLPFLKVK